MNNYNNMESILMQQIEQHQKMVDFSNKEIECLRGKLNALPKLRKRAAALLRCGCSESYIQSVLYAERFPNTSIIMIKTVIFEALAASRDLPRSVNLHKVKEA